MDFAHTRQATGQEPSAEGLAHPARTRLNGHGLVRCRKGLFDRAKTVDN